MINFSDLYNLAKKKLEFGQVLVIEQGCSSFEDCSDGAYFIICEEAMSGIYPIKEKEKEFCVGFPNIFGEFQAICIDFEGFIYPVYNSWDGWQKYTLELDSLLEPFKEPPKVSFKKPFYDF